MELLIEHESITKENALEKLKEVVELRDKMGGSLHWNILNDEACQIADKCLSYGYNRFDIENVLGRENFTY